VAGREEVGEEVIRDVGEKGRREREKELLHRLLTPLSLSHSQTSLILPLTQDTHSIEFSSNQLVKTKFDR